jgi:hypothetical protein
MSIVLPPAVVNDQPAGCVPLAPVKFSVQKPAAHQDALADTTKPIAKRHIGIPPKVDNPTPSMGVERSKPRASQVPGDARPVLFPYVHHFKALMSE